MIKVMIDSAADISREEANKLGITMVPMSIMFGDEEYFDGVDLTANDFYKKLVECSVLPKTSLVNSARWEEEFEKCVNNGDELIVITISSKLSGTYRSAVEASEKFNGKVKVVDSLNATTGEKLLCLYAIDLIKKGNNINEIIALLEEKKTKLKVMAVVGTLEYLKKGGRISSAAAFAGELMSIKPIVGIVDGEVKVLGKAMGVKKGQLLLNKIVQQTKGIDFSLPYGVLWSGIETDGLEKYIKDSATLWPNIDNLARYQFGATIGTHVGPGAVGLAYFEE